MKKIVFIFSLLLFGAVYADTSIWDVSVLFCTQTGSMVKDASFTLPSGKPYELCLYFLNNSSEKLKVDFSFVDWILTSDVLQKKACDAKPWLVTPFVHFPFSWLTVPWNTKIKLTGYVEFPVWFSGNIQWCLVYNLAKKTSSNSMFDIIVRRANFFDGVVFWEINRWERFENEKKSYTMYSTWLSISLPFVNTWNIDVMVEISGSLYNTLGYERPFYKQQLLSYWSSLLLSYSFEDIPFYKLAYVFSWKILFKPLLDTSLFSLSELHAESSGEDIYYKIFLVPYTILWWIWGTILFLFVLRILFRKKH